MDNKINTVDDKELEQVVGGMTEIEDAILNGTVMGHILNARQSAEKTKNDRILNVIPVILMQCQNRGYAEIVSQISGMLPTGVYDSSDNDAYDSLKKAKETIENSGVLNA